MTHQSHAYVCNQENRKFMCIQNLYINVHDGFIHCHEKLETTQTSFSCWKNNQTMTYTLNGTLLSKKRNRLLTQAIAWKDLKGIMITERTKRLHMCDSTYMTSETNKIIGTEDRSGVEGGGGLGETDCKRAAWNDLSGGRTCSMSWSWWC